jgi:deoxyribodipyrimidine photo-lyase
MKKYNKSLFIFRRDLRLNDNIGLMNALQNSKIIISVFIFTPEQLINNSYKSDNCVQFMMESLDDLNNSLKKKGSRLFYFFGKTNEIIDKILKHSRDIDSVYVNMDYTPYSIKRDVSIKKICNQNDVDFNCFEDVLLNPIGSIRNGSDNIYQKFTPYFKVATKTKIIDTNRNNYSNYINKKYKIVGEFKGNIHKFYNPNDKLAIRGGRTLGIKSLAKIKKFNKYNNNRNTLKMNTTQLSAYIKFGCVSIREVYHKFKKKLGVKNDLIKQLYWRDFYYNISYEWPRVFQKNKNMKTKYDKIKWNTNTKHFKKWKDGMTGFPVVDAAMREMNVTGFMHNRGRLITSNFLIKILGINWKIGEKYFAQTLIDYDPSVNNGNWGWSAGSGADSQPYFRIFNPWLQSKKHDNGAIYIKKWIPELVGVHPDDIHQWYDFYDHEDYSNIKYPKPMVNYTKMKQKTLKMYTKALYDNKKNH